MTQEDKELLLKDLCARLPYGVKGLAYIAGEPCNINTNVNGVINNSIVTDYKSPMLELINLNSKDITIKPYLRSMSSMTEEEINEFEQITDNLLDNGTSEEIWNTVIDWLNAHHFDHRHLIPRGLAIEVTPENNPYKV